LVIEISLHYDARSKKHQIVLKFYEMCAEGNTLWVFALLLHAEHFNTKRTVSSYLSNRFKIDFHRGII